MYNLNAARPALAPFDSYPIGDADMIVLMPFEKYLETRGYKNVKPEESIRLYEHYCDPFYSDIIGRFQRIIPYIIFSSVDDDKALGMKISLFHHFRNRRFVDIMRHSLASINNSVLTAQVGALICEAVSYYVTECKKADEAKIQEIKAEKDDKSKDKSKDKNSAKTTEINSADDEIISFMYTTAQSMLDPEYQYVRSQYPGLKDGEALMIAAYLAMNNEITVKSLIASDLPLTADLFENFAPIRVNPGYIIGVLLTLEKSDYSKLSKNQETFIKTLESWAYKRLDMLPLPDCFDYLANLYGTAQPADIIKSKLIQPQDCGTKYPQLFQVVKALKINK